MVFNKQYHNFDILITPSTEAYTVRVIRSPAGQAQGSLVIPFTQEEMDVLRFWNPTQIKAQFSSRSFGARLFDALFSGGIADCLRMSQGQLNPDAGLRINLHLTDVPDLAMFPWEYLYDTRSNRFLALSDKSPIVRYLDLPIGEGSLEVKLPLHILVVLSSPIDCEPALDVELEWARLQASLTPLVAAKAILLNRIDVASWENLQSHLLRHPTHILHFIGHGYLDPDTQEGGLLLETAANESAPISALKLGILLHNHHWLRLVVLNACESGIATPQNPLSGVAQTLVQQGIPAVVAMQQAISDHAAVTFSSTFYAAIANSYPVDAALTHARVAISSSDGISWALPVLFMRSDGKLFVHEISTTTEDHYPLPELPKSPFIGTVPYTSAQAHLFFGRSQRVDELLVKIETEYSPLLVINGLSGSGKTSLLRAGLVPRLRTKGYNVVYSNILDKPEQDVASAIYTEFQAERQPGLDLVDVVNTVACANKRPLILIIDQLERCFTLAKDTPEREKFIRNVARLLSGTAACRVKIIFSIRSDWLYAIQQESANLHIGVFNYLYMLEPLTPAEAKQAFQGPLDLVGITYDPSVIDLVIAELTNQDGYVNPPHLQIVGEMIYRECHRLGEPRITEELYRNLGDVHTIIRLYFDKVVNLLGPQA